MNVFILLTLLMITGPLQAQVKPNLTFKRYDYSSMTNLEKLKALLDNSGVVDLNMGDVSAYLNVKVVDFELGNRVGNTNKQKLLLEISYILEKIYDSNIQFSEEQANILSRLNDFVTAQLEKVNNNISNVKETRNKICDRLGVDRLITDEELDKAVAEEMLKIIPGKNLPEEEATLILFEYYEYISDRIVVLTNGKDIFKVDRETVLGELIFQKDMLNVVIGGRLGNAYRAPYLLAKKMNGVPIDHLLLPENTPDPIIEKYGKMIEPFKVVK
ncbi:MAG: hypothetical protein WCQ47_02975 [bacterium]